MGWDLSGDWGLSYDLPEVGSAPSPGEACLLQLPAVPDGHVSNLPALLVPHETLIPSSSPAGMSLL